MNITITYREGKAYLEGVNLNGLSPKFRAYTEELMKVHEKHMKKMDENSERKPEGKLIVKLEMSPR